MRLCSTLVIFLCTRNTMATQGGVNVNLRKFVMKSVPQDAVVVFIGRRRTGKSTLVRDLLFHHQDLPMGCVISGTEESNGFFKKIVPPMFIHGEYNPVILANFVKRQKLVMSRIQQDEGKGVKTNIDPRAFLILDDCMYDDSWTHDKNIRYLFMNGRWLKVFFVITMQFPLGIQPALSTNVDYVFLVINNNTQSNKLEDTIFWYKADIHGDFKMGAPELWRQSEMLSRIKEEDDVNNYDPRNSVKLRGPAINVQKKY